MIAWQENDIILCDGNCRRAYHEKCLDPPLIASALPEDEGWLCPACDAKVSFQLLHHQAQQFSGFVTAPGPAFNIFLNYGYKEAGLMVCPAMSVHSLSYAAVQCCVCHM